MSNQVVKKAYKFNITQDGVTTELFMIAMSYGHAIQIMTINGIMHDNDVEFKHSLEIESVEAA